MFYILGTWYPFAKTHWLAYLKLIILLFTIGTFYLLKKKKEEKKEL